MLEIRPEQLTILKQNQILDFKRRLRKYLEKRLLEKGIKITTDSLSNQIDECTTIARYYKLGRECDTARFVEIVCTHLNGITNKTQSKDALRILYDHRKKPEEKLDKFEQWAKESRDKKLEI